MISFPNAKINIGLRVLGKRADGFHNIESVFYPIGLQDSLELLPVKGSQTMDFTSSGIHIPGLVSDNLCQKAYELIAKDYPLPGIKVHLHKYIPIGAGLGGGSADGAFFVRLLNETLELGLAWGEMHHYAKQLGSDCSFFISNRPAMVTGRGDEMEPVDLSLEGYKLVLVCPPVHINTAEAYKMLEPEDSTLNLEDFITNRPISEWKDVVKNDFEKSVFKKHPVLESIKKALYKEGALYASMTGSGSSIYGIFDERSTLHAKFDSCFFWEGILA
jgi:4-diphosphocytidyl-2-C-methyl-D-erythritol kinase